MAEETHAEYIARVTANRSIALHDLIPGDVVTWLVEDPNTGEVRIDTVVFGGPPVPADEDVAIRYLPRYTMRWLLSDGTPGGGVDLDAYYIESRLVERIGHVELKPYQKAALQPYMPDDSDKASGDKCGS